MDAIPSERPMGLKERQTTPLGAVPSWTATIDLQEAVAPIPAVVAQETMDATRGTGAPAAVGEAAGTESRAPAPSSAAVAATAEPSWPTHP